MNRDLSELFGEGPEQGLEDLQSEVTREEYEDARKVKREMEELAEHPGFQRLIRTIEIQAAQRDKQGNQPMTGVEDVLSRQLLIGEAMGLRLAQQLRETFIQTADLTIEQFRQYGGDDDATGSDERESDSVE